MKLKNFKLLFILIYPMKSLENTVIFTKFSKILFDILCEVIKNAKRPVQN